MTEKRALDSVLTILYVHMFIIAWSVYKLFTEYPEADYGVSPQLLGLVIVDVLVALVFTFGRKKLIKVGAVKCEKKG